MTNEEYLMQATHSDSPNIQHINPQVLHGAIGCGTEAGELLDAVKKAMFYGRELDTLNVKEELGDLLWYIALICNALDWSLNEVMEANIAKLRVRYPQQFTPEQAQQRDLHAELSALSSRK